MVYLLSATNYELMLNVMQLENTYGRVLAVHQLNQKVDNLFTKDPLFAYLGVWAYAEYFSYQGEEYFDESLLREMEAYLAILHQLHNKKFLYSKYAMTLEQVPYSSINAPVLSSMAWGFLKEKFSKTFVYVEERNKALYLTDFAEIQFKGAESPKKLLGFWIKLLKEQPQFDHVESGLGQAFKTQCLSVPGMLKVLYPESGVFSQPGVVLWNTLVETKFESIELIRALLSHIIQHQAVESFITQISETKDRAYLELALMMNPEAFKVLVNKDESPKDISVQIIQALGSQSPYELKDRIKLLNNMAGFVQDKTLNNLAKQYADNSWIMFSAIKLLAANKKYDLEPYYRLEQDNEAKLKLSWGHFLNDFEKLISELEVEPQDDFLEGVKAVTNSFPASANFLSSLASSSFVQQITQSLDPNESIRTDLQKIMKEGLDTTKQPTSTQMYQVLCQFKKEYPQEPRLTLTHLPYHFQQRLELLVKPQSKQENERASTPIELSPL